MNAMTLAGALSACALSLLPCTTLCATAAPGGAPTEAEFPASATVLDGLERVISVAGDASSYLELYRNESGTTLLAVLPRDHDRALSMIACTISGGDPESGVMGPTYFVRWERRQRMIALIEPNLAVQTTGDAEARASVDHLFTGRVLATVPIVALTPDGRPVIDLGALCAQQPGAFFGRSIFGGVGPSFAGFDARLAELTKVKSFPENAVVQYEAPARNGRLTRLTYSIGALRGTPGFEPRAADSRVGYFYTWHDDYAKAADTDTVERFITRWHLEKRDPSLALSPPTKPIVWYVEHTVPVRYRRYVRDGLLMWNDAFRRIGIDGAVEVYQQDAATGVHMDKDPEDARYNFFRWNVSDEGYAIGPSRAHPFTGEILDADIVWHQGLTRAISGMLSDLSRHLTETAFDADALAFFAAHPTWDPRVRFGAMAPGAVDDDAAPACTCGAAHHDSARHSGTTPGACLMSRQLALDLALVNATVSAGLLDDVGGAELDGLPEAYIGPMIRYISAHEAGHCLGLQHNMAASSLHTLEALNSPGFSGPSVGSVMDYAAVNINHELGAVQGPYATAELGPYDHWAIAFGYGDAADVDDVLAQVAEPGHLFVSQSAIGVGSDPRNAQWDLGANNLNFARSRLSLVDELRRDLIDDVIADGESWESARLRYGELMGTQLQSLFFAASWVGGSYINNDHKGDPGNRAPLDDVAAADQRAALALIIEHSFEDDAYGLTPDLLRHLGRDYWYEVSFDTYGDPSFNIHDLVSALQGTGMSLVLNPTTLRRVYDNEFRAEPGSDPLTVAEVMATVRDAVWTTDAARTSLRRNLQREHVDRLIDLALLGRTTSPAQRTMSSLALLQLDALARELAAERDHDDVYDAAHRAALRRRVDTALDASVVIPR